MKKDADREQSGVTPRGRWRRMVHYLLAFAGCVLVIDAIVGNKGVLQMLKKRDEARALDRKVAVAHAENARLRLKLQRLRTDDAALEELAREQLGLIKPGEKLFIIKDAPPAGARPESK